MKNRKKQMTIAQRIKLASACVFASTLLLTTLALAALFTGCDGVDGIYDIDGDNKASPLVQDGQLPGGAVILSEDVLLLTIGTELARQAEIDADKSYRFDIRILFGTYQRGESRVGASRGDGREVRVHPSAANVPSVIRRDLGIYLLQALDIQNGGGHERPIQVTGNDINFETGKAEPE